jgi:hypothetical protein
MVRCRDDFDTTMAVLQRTNFVPVACCAVDDIWRTPVPRPLHRRTCLRLPEILPTKCFSAAAVNLCHIPRQYSARQHFTASQMGSGSKFFKNAKAHVRQRL